MPAASPFSINGFALRVAASFSVRVRTQATKDHALQVTYRRFGFGRAAPGLNGGSTRQAAGHASSHG
jgi:hypothetical protein